MSRVCIGELQEEDELIRVVVDETTVVDNGTEAQSDLARTISSNEEFDFVRGVGTRSSKSEGLVLEALQESIGKYLSGPCMFIIVIGDGEVVIEIADELFERNRRIGMLIEGQEEFLHSDEADEASQEK